MLTTPVIRALKKQLNCELHVLTKSQYKSILLNNPYIDKVHSFNEKVSEVVDMLKAEQFEFVVDLQKNLRSVKLRKALKKPGASFPKLNRQKWLIVNFKIDLLPDIHIVDRYFKAVESLDVKNDGFGLDFFIPKEDHLDLLKISPTLKNGYVGFVIGGRHNTKICPPEKIESIF